jgi:hypothetical protein
MNRSIHVTGTAAQSIKRQFLKCDEVTYSVPLCSTFIKVSAGQHANKQLFGSMKTAIDENIRKDESDQTGQPRAGVLQNHLQIPDQCRADLKSLNLEAILGSLGRRECIEYVTRSYRKKTISDGLARRRVLSRSRRDVLYAPMTQSSVSNSISCSPQKQWVSTRSFSVSAAVRPPG